jgi:hypothetical protein
VTVANPDGSGSFTGLDQPYFQYPGNLSGGATSSEKSWVFAVSGTVTSFSFQVLVRAQVPQAQGVLRWLGDSLGASGTLYGVSGTSATNLLAAGVFDIDELLGGRILRWDGLGWTVVRNFADLLYGVWTGGGAVLSVGPDGVIWFSPDNGTQWTRTRIATGVLLTSAWGSAANDLFVAGSGGTILHSANGTTWTPMTSGATQYLNQIWGTSASDIWAVGYNGTVVHYDGVSWAPRPVPSGSATTAFFGIGGVPGGEVFAVGAGGTILHSVNGGLDWTPQASGTTANLRGVWCASTTDCVAVGEQGVIRRWNGTLWSPMSSGTAKALRAVWGAGASAVFVAGDQGTMLRGVR